MILILKKVKTTIENHKPLKTAIHTGLFIVVLFAIYTAGYVFIEKTSTVEGIWQSWQTFTTVGYGNRPAESEIGRYFSIIFGTIGIAVMAVFIAVCSDLRQYFKERRRLGFMENGFVNGYVILNYPGDLVAMRVIEQIQAEESGVPVCFVDPVLEQLPPSIESMNNIHFMKGSLTERHTYEKSNIANNKAVIVFPSDPSSPDADLHTKSIVTLVDKFTGNEKVSVLYILTNQKNRWMFPKTATPILDNLWIMALAQECNDQGSSTIIEKLINNTDNESINSLTVRSKSPTVWKHIRDQINSKGVNVVGLRKLDKTSLVPSEDTIIEENDIIYVASANNVNLDNLHNEVFGPWQ